MLHPLSQDTSGVLSLTTDIFAHVILESPKAKKTETNLLLQLRTMEHRRLRYIEEVSILNQSSKRVSLRGQNKACYLRWCPGSRVGATESVPVCGYQCPFYTGASCNCLRQWARWNLLRHRSGVMNEWGRQETERGGADRRGFSWKAGSCVKTLDGDVRCADSVRGGDFLDAHRNQGGREDEWK